jgi:hypothetical protein
MGDAFIVTDSISRLFCRWVKAAPSWVNDITEILGGAEGYHCPITGAHVSAKRQGFMMRVTIRGYGDKADAARCANILAGESSGAH